MFYALLVTLARYLYPKSYTALIIETQRFTQTA